MVERVMNQMPIYLAFAKNSFLRILAYRLRYYSGILNYLFFVSVYYFIWQAVFANQGADFLINGFSLSEMVAYVAVGWIARSFYFSNIDHEINDLVQTGQVTIYLLRPVNFQVMMLFQAAGESLFRLCFFSVPVGIVIFVLFPISGPSSFAYLLLFALSTLLGFLIFAAVNFLVGLLAFSLQSILGVMRAKSSIIQLCSGLLLPIPFFPGWAQSILHALPFKSIAYTPLMFYLGKIPQDEILWILGQQFVWAAVLLLLGHYCWSRALAKIVLQGG
ncbi:ABC-2 family transporter protein [Oligoflexia bacterium]|nr:ABC-2 family transporter protein [Oligoflexia bacterium]